MNKTHDFKLNMPDYSDAVDIDILNDNFRVIDDALMAGLCEKEYTGNNMGSSDPASRKYAWAPWFEIKNENDFDVQVTDRNFETTITIEAGGTYRKYIVGTYYMNFYVQDQHDVTFRWFTDAETRINEIDPSGGGSVSSVNVTGASNSHIVTSGGPITSSGTIEIDLAEGYSIPQTNKQTSWDGKAADLKAEIDSSTYVLTLQLKDSSGNLIGNERTIDLPLETMVVDGEYDSQTKKIKLELKNGNYVEFSVADLVSGLQTELSASNKLDPDYIDYDSSHRAVSDTEKDTWNGKQNAISDLATIRSGAAAGATAVQPSTMEDALDDKQDTIDSTHKLSSALVSFSTAQNAALASGVNSTKVGQISTNQTNILSVADWIGKNVLDAKSFVTSGQATGITVTVNDDCSVTLNGTSSSSNNIIYGYFDAVVKPNTRYAMKGTGNSNVKIQLIGYNDINNPTVIFNDINDNVGSSGNWQYYRVRLWIAAKPSSGTQFSNVTIYPMLCPEELWNTSHDFAPYSLPNYDLTRLESEDRAALAEEIDAGAKNKFDINDVYYNKSGVDYSVNDNTGTYIVSTTSITYSRTMWNLSLKANVAYKLSFDVTAISTTDKIRVFPTKSSTAQSATWGQLDITQTGHYELEFTPTAEQIWLTVYLNITDTARIVSCTITNLMICTKAAFGVSNKFVPYRPNYDAVSKAAMSAAFTHQTIQNTDLNSINKNYYGLYQSATNMPSGTSGFAFVRTTWFDSQAAMQELTLLAATSNSYVRVKYGNAWTAWKQVTNA